MSNWEKVDRSMLDQIMADRETQCAELRATVHRTVDEMCEEAGGVSDVSRLAMHRKADAFVTKQIEENDLHMESIRAKVEGAPVH